MKLQKSIFYIIPLLVFLFLDELFIPYPYNEGAVSGEFYRENLWLFSKFIPFIAIFYVLIIIWKQRKNHIVLSAIPILYFIYLIFESLYLYNRFFEYPHVISKIMYLIITTAFFLFYINRKFTYYNLVMNLILAALIMKIAINPQGLSAQSFLSSQRGIPASSALLLLLPCIYFFNVYVIELKQMALIKFLFFLLMIIFFQHRTVWVVTSATFLFNMFVLRKQGVLKLDKAIQRSIPIGFVIFFISSIALTYLPNVIEKINKNIENIINPTGEETTSEWRIRQMQAYMPFVMDHPIDGMRFKGFELPVQFENPSSGNLAFEDNTGHHFHSFYFDRLFYFGLIGVFIFLLYLVRPVYLVLKYNLRIDHQQMSFLCFSFGGLIYGLSYDLPGFYYAILGISIAIVEKNLLERSK